MKKPIPSRSVSDLIALVDAMIAYWKSIAELGCKQTNPNSDLAEFERVWPKVLNNFFTCGDRSHYKTAESVFP